MKTSGYKIRKIRERKNYTQEHVADQLGISQNAYSKVENDQTQLTVDRLSKLAKVFDVSELEMLEDVPNFVLNSHDNEKGYNGFINNFFDSQKGAYEQTIEVLQAQVKELRAENKRLMDLIEKKLLNL